jgi:hypothetical protein
MKMNKYDDVKNELQEYINVYGMDYYQTNHFPITTKFIKQAEATEKELENTKYQLSVVKDNALKLQNKLVEIERNVKRYFELTYTWRNLSKDEQKENDLLYKKLSKVGNEE